MRWAASQILASKPTEQVTEIPPASTSISRGSPFQQAKVPVCVAGIPNALQSRCPCRGGGVPPRRWPVRKRRQPPLGVPSPPQARIRSLRLGANAQRRRVAGRGGPHFVFPPVPAICRSIIRAAGRCCRFAGRGVEHKNDARLSSPCFYGKGCAFTGL